MGAQSRGLSSTCLGSGLGFRVMVKAVKWLRLGLTMNQPEPNPST